MVSLGLALLVVGSGCSLSPRFNQRQDGNRAFIAYWPPVESNGKLRLAVKDNIDMKGRVTSAGSEYLAKNRAPAAADAPCLAIARERNVYIVGKANMSEFAISPSGFNQYFGTPPSPLARWRKLIPGGSSSGSAMAVTSGLADVAFGTDTAGSIRAPAACCGIVGLKTTFGLVPLKGVFPIDPKHLDTVGPMGKDIAHTVQGMELLQGGFASRYAAARAAKPSAAGIRVGRLRLKGTGRKIDEAVDRSLAQAGFQVIELGDRVREQWEQANKDGDRVAAGAAWISDHKYFDKPGVSAATKSVLLVGKLSYETGYRKSLARRAEWQRTLRKVFGKVDFIALPTIQSTPPLLLPSARTGTLEIQMILLQNTVPVNLAGNPALAVPIPLRHSSVRVTSLQLVGSPRSEAGLLNAGRLVEAAVKKE